MIVITLLCLLFVLIACITLSNANTYSPPTQPPSAEPVEPAATIQIVTHTPDPHNSKLIFGEEFSGTELDTTVWATEYRWGQTNKPELQYYSPDALQVKDGILRITAEKRHMDGMDYTSGVIASFDRFTFTYGYVEMRAKLPQGQGLWPAFWMHLNNDDKSGEIDIFELLGHEPNIIHMTYHFPDANGVSEDIGFSFSGPNYSEDYHVYSVDWQPDKIVWYIDGIERARATQNIPSEPMYIIANLAVGGTWPGSPDETTRFPAYYDIDYIRVYKEP